MPSRQFGFSFNQNRCSGCHTCELACKDYHQLGDGLSYRTIHEFVGGAWQQSAPGIWEQDVFSFYVSMSCNHCSNPACLRFCPTDSIKKDEHGFVMVEGSTCEGCQSCMIACPYHAPRFEEASGHTVKCDGCRDRIEEGLAPVCVEACPQRALEFGLYSDLAEGSHMVEQVGFMPDPQITQPNYTIEPSDFAVATALDARLANKREA
ncbi:MAG: 4Fe-4S dicluster domain-containing protein [Adlercreutzia sp.]|nr:4Fe-4S dicluster domain-containing protein [Adlercreutzia sp.]